MATKRRDAQTAGGFHRRAITNSSYGPYIIKTMPDLLTILQDVINDVCLLGNSLARARTIAYICGIIVRIAEGGTLNHVFEELLSSRERVMRDMFPFDSYEKDNSETE